MLSHKASLSLSVDNEAFGFNAVANERYIYDGSKLEYMGEGIKRKGDKDRANENFTNLKRARALSWWILNNGYIIPNDASINDDQLNAQGNE